MKSDYVVALAKAHVDGDRERARGIILAIAAQEATRSPRTAKSLREIADRQQTQFNQFVMLPDQRDLFRIREPPTTRLHDMVLDEVTVNVLAGFVGQYRRRDELLELGLEPDRKFLFEGPPGVGKTMAAMAIAGELGMHLVRIELHGVISSHLGETAGKLAKVFQVISSRPAVYLFDEFDALSPSRGSGQHDTGEMRRVVSSLLQMIEDDRGSSIIIATSNFGESIDAAMFRRLDDMLSFFPPTEAEVRKLIEGKLIVEWENELNWAAILEAARCGDRYLSHADILAATARALKSSFMKGHRRLGTASLCYELGRRHRRSVSR